MRTRNAETKDTKPWLCRPHKQISLSIPPSSIATRWRRLRRHAPISRCLWQLSTLQPVELLQERWLTWTTMMSWCVNSRLTLIQSQLGYSVFIGFAGRACGSERAAGIWSSASTISVKVSQTDQKTTWTSRWWHSLRIRGLRGRFSLRWVWPKMHRCDWDTWVTIDRGGGGGDKGHRIWIMVRTLPLTV